VFQAAKDWVRLGEFPSSALSILFRRYRRRPGRDYDVGIFARPYGGGLNYLGVSAGAFFAETHPITDSISRTARASSSMPRSIRKAAVRIEIAGSATFDHYWEDGPQLTGWRDVVAKFPDGTPAIVQGTTGDGWVVLSGVHPEAQDSWHRGLTFSTPAQ
jgi:hypothetical protein